ncbi:MAG TPA: GGDEF domain-containing protein [Terracidiphilus sp.]|nr:GGDEF domain-containing protein [Terracidiphilus sp.]
MQIESTFPAHEPNQNLLHKAYFAEQICLALAIQIVLINLLSRVFVVVNNLLPAGMLHMRVYSALAVLSATLALFFTEGRRYQRLYRAGKVLAGLTTLTAAMTFWAPAAVVLAQLDQFLNRGQISQSRGPMHAVALAFVLLGIVIFFLRSRDSLFGSIADAAATFLVMLVLIVLFEYIFATAGIPGSSTEALPSIPTLVCLALLALVSIIRRAEYGVFSVFLGDGIGGRIARILAPILLILPFLRELGRARLLSTHVVSMPYATAILASIATVVSFALLLVLVRLINNMQTEIHGLTLRDELTGLYNFRGFNLFAEQAFRLARRAKMPFGILFVDMDNLKIINDELGHNAGSISLIETAKLLSATFRETDVIGRLGGDEFVVAGQFDSEEIANAIDRLRSGAAARTQLAGNQFFLSLSMGYAASDHSTEETLKSIVSRADKAMYKEKRAKKRIA